MKLEFTPNNYDGPDYNIVVDGLSAGKCDKLVVDSFTRSFMKSYDNGYDKALLDIVNDLKTLKWIGEDEGWDLAVDKIQKDLSEKLQERIGK